MVVHEPTIKKPTNPAQNLGTMSLNGSGGGVVFVNEGIISNATNKGSLSLNISERCMDCSTNIQSYTSYLGGVVAQNKGTMEKVVNEGYIDVDAFANGVHNSGSSGCYTHCGLNVTVNQGGVAGANYSESKITNSANLGTVAYSGRNGSSGQGGKVIGVVGGMIGQNEGGIENSFNTYARSLVHQNLGEIKNSYSINDYSEEAMKTNQFAWILNTTNGTTENSEIWSRGDSYPFFATEENKAIYKIVFYDDDITLSRYTNNKGLVPFPEDPEPAEGLVFSGWFNADDIRVKPATVFVADQTVNAVYVDASNVFWTINFYNAAPADTLLESKSYQHGSIVTYDGEVPTKEQTTQYSYTFKGWDIEPTNAVEDFDYHAVYDSTIRSYTVVFNNYDGAEIESGTYEYGKTPACSLAPARAATAEWTYSHKGWDPAVDVVTGPATYTATFDSSKVEYKVTFMNGTAVIDEQMVSYGDAAVAPTNVSREGYKFVGWNISFTKVTENLTVKALFEELPTYFVKIVDDGGAKIDSVNVKEGGVYFLPEPETREGYAFAGYFNEGMGFILTGEGITVTADIVITAFYAEIPKSSSSSTPKSSSSSIRSSSSAKSSSSSAKSSSSVRSSSSSSKLSSSSAKTSIVMQNSMPKFRVSVNSRGIQLSGAEFGTAYVLFDMQGRVLQRGRIVSASFNIAVPNVGQYFVKVGNQVRKVNVVD